MGLTGTGIIEGVPKKKYQQDGMEVFRLGVRRGVFFSSFSFQNLIPFDGEGEQDKTRNMGWMDDGIEISSTGTGWGIWFGAELVNGVGWLHVLLEVLGCWDVACLLALGEGSWGMDELN